jgi:hypothetical protein
MCLSMICLYIDLVTSSFFHYPYLHTTTLLYYVQISQPMSMIIPLFTACMIAIQYFIYYQSLSHISIVLSISTVCLILYQRRLKAHMYVSALLCTLLYVCQRILFYTLQYASVDNRSLNLTSISLHFIIVLIILKLYKR